MVLSICSLVKKALLLVLVPIKIILILSRKTCTDTPEKLLIFARNKDIRLRQLGQGKEVGIVDMVIPLDQVRSAVALAFDSDRNTIYWSDVESHKISRSFLNGSRQEMIISSNLGKRFQKNECFRY